MSLRDAPEQSDAGTPEHLKRTLRDAFLAQSVGGKNGSTPIERLRALLDQARKNARAGDLTEDDVKDAISETTGMDFAELASVEQNSLPLNTTAAVMQVGKHLLQSRMTFNDQVVRITKVEPYQDNDKAWGNEIVEHKKKRWESEEAPYKNNDLLIRPGMMGHLNVTQLTSVPHRQLVRIAEIDPVDSDFEGSSTGKFLRHAGGVKQGDSAAKDELLLLLNKHNPDEIPNFSIEQDPERAESGIEIVHNYPAKGKTLPHGSMGMWKLQ